MDEIVLRKNLQKLLEDYEVSAADLSRTTGIAKQVLSDWMAGRMPKDLRKLRKVASYFGRSIDDLCFQVEAPTPARQLEKQLLLNGNYEVRIYKNIEDQAQSD